MFISPAAALADGGRLTRPGGGPVPASAAAAPGAESDTKRAVAFSKDYGKLPLSFEANTGQHDSRVKFLARGGGCTLMLTASEAVVSFSPPAQKRGAAPVQTPSTAGARSAGATLRMSLVGADPRARVAGADPLPGKVNYLLGNDPAKWRSNIPTFAKVAYDEVYPGVDLVYYGNQEQLEYDLVVAPGASPRVIKLAFAGAGKPALADTGELVLQTPAGPIRWSQPVVYQNADAGRKHVAGRYVVEGDGGVRIEVGDYDVKKPLVIDPVLVYSTFLGGSTGEDIGNDIDVDSSGNAYVVGHTSSTDFAVQNALQQSHQGPAQSWWESAPYDAFVTKLNSSGTGMVYSTFLGGSNIEYGYSIRVSGTGEAYIAGATASGNFPIVGKPKQPQKDVYLDAFMTRLSSDGSSIIYSTFYGGISNDYGYALDLGPTGLVYLGGQKFFEGFIAVINPDPECLDEVREHCEQPPGVAYDNSDLVHAMTLGGNGSDIIRGLAVDGVGNVVVAGTTDSTNFPVSVNAIQPTKNPSVYLDSFVTKIDVNFVTTIYSTYLGGSSQDYALGVAVDSSGNAYVVGTTSSANFPTSSCALQNVYRGGIEDAFVTKLSPFGVMVYSTYLGGRSNSDIARAVAVDSLGNAYVTGTTASNDFPVTQGAYQTASRSGPEDGFVTKLNAQGDLILYSTYIGDSGVDQARSIALDSSNNVYLTGNTVSPNFPTTAGALQTTYAGDGTYGTLGDAFVAKLSLVTPNPTDDGPNAVSTAEYKFDDVDDPDVIGGRQTELWARVYWPTGLSGGPRPLLVFLHGNHGTCGMPNPPNPRDDSTSHYDEYAVYGHCTGGSVVVPNHEGYGYLANKLASWGYVVVSINANLGINVSEGTVSDPDLIYARGRLVLKHIQRLSEWAGTNTAFVRTKTFGSLRNNQSAWLGMKITTGPQDIVVRSLGRLKAFANTGTHTVKIVRASDGADVASAAVSMAGGVGDQFKYATLATPVTLTKDTAYYVVSQETSGGDYWYETTVMSSGVAATGGRVSSTDGVNWTVSGAANEAYVQLDFTYDVPTPSTLGIDLKGKLDFAQVGMMGHSRGGEGVRAAYNFYQEATDTGAAPWKRYINPAVNFRAIFEIAPTDQMSAYQARAFKATGTKWNVLLPMCDGDVADLQGVQPFDRMMHNSPDNRAENPPTQKSTYTVWGANHNYYNTEWQVSETYAVCLDHTPLFTSPFGSASQRQTALDSLVPFFRANVGAGGDLTLNQRFDPLYKLPVAVSSVTRIERGFTPTTKSYLTTIVEDFDKPHPQNSSGNANDIGPDLSVSYGTVDRHDPSLKAGLMQWTTAGANTFFQSNWTATGSGVNVYGNETLDFRITRLPSSSLNPSGPTNFSVRLVMANGTMSQPVKLCSYINLIGPVGGALGRHPILQTVRIPLGDFRETDVLNVRGVRFVFDETASGLIAIANIRFAR